MKILCFATGYNKWLRRDGAEFKREMYRAMEVWQAMGHTVSSHVYDKKKTGVELRGETLGVLRAHDHCDMVAFFCHGGWRDLYGAGFNIWTSVLLVKALQRLFKDSDHRKVVLYACSCGRGKKKKWYMPGGNQKHVTMWGIRGEHGFAEMLHYHDQKLSGVSDHKPLQVYAHQTSGHTTRNPYLVKSNGSRTYAPWSVSTSPWAVSRFGARKNPKGRKRWLSWIKLMSKTNLRFTFPLKKDKQLKREVDAWL